MLDSLTSAYNQAVYSRADISIPYITLILCVTPYTVLSALISQVDDALSAYLALDLDTVFACVGLLERRGISGRCATVELRGFTLSIPITDVVAWFCSSSSFEPLIT